MPLSLSGLEVLGGGVLELALDDGVLELALDDGVLELALDDLSASDELDAAPDDELGLD